MNTVWGEDGLQLKKMSESYSEWCWCKIYLAVFPFPYHMSYFFKVILTPYLLYRTKTKISRFVSEQELLLRI